MLPERRRLPLVTTRARQLDFALASGQAPVRPAGGAGDNARALKALTSANRVPRGLGIDVAFLVGVCGGPGPPSVGDGRGLRMWKEVTEARSARPNEDRASRDRRNEPKSTESAALPPS